MTLHKEGTNLLISIAIVLIVINVSIFAFSDSNALQYSILSVSIVLYLLVINFFRYIPRKHPRANDENVVVSPADGKVVVIEETFEKEILGEKCLQVSIFMNVFNMHVNWMPTNGTVIHKSHHKGRFMAANLPKSSTENERSAVVIRKENGQKVLVRQIAGAIAQRIVTYSSVGEVAKINDNLGFIKFGSRVDMYLPLGSKIFVKVGDKVDGNINVIAELPSNE